jgi:hypothetical protein
LRDIKLNTGRFLHKGLIQLSEDVFIREQAKEEIERRVFLFLVVAAEVVPEHTEGLRLARPVLFGALFLEREEGREGGRDEGSKRKHNYARQENEYR